VSLLSNQLNDLTAKFNAGVLATDEPHGKIFKIKGTFVGHQGQVWCLAMTGDVLFSGGGDADIKCWDTTQTFRCQKTLEGHTKPILAMVVQNQQLFSTGLDQSILLWNVAQLSFVHRIDKAHDKAVCSIAATSKYLFTGSLNSVKVWSIQENPIANNSKGVFASLTNDDRCFSAPIEYLRELKDVSNYVRSLAVSGNKLYGGSTKLITIWDINSFTLLKQVTMQGTD
jgi:E3 ubiquitin-protein ligase TRAF7